MKLIFFQLVVVMLLVLAFYNALIQPDSAPAMLVTRVQNVTLLVVVIPLDQVVNHVIS